jgi:hypothetical protein
MSASRKTARGLLTGRAADGASIGFADPANENRAVIIDEHSLLEEIETLDGILSDITATMSEV